MNPQRPPIVVVMAILNMIFGFLFIAYQVCCNVLINVLGVSMLQSFLSSVPSPPPGSMRPGQNDPLEALRGMPKLWEYCPGYFPVHITGAVLGILLGGLLIVAGIGLISMRGWARQTCLVIGLLQVLLALGNLGYALFVENPGADRWVRELAVRMRQPVQSNSVMTENVKAFGHFAFNLIYPLALVIVMCLPSVEMAFAGRASQESEPLDYDDRPLPPPPRSDDDRFRPYPT